jgi:hypothetical protein
MDFLFLANHRLLPMARLAMPSPRHPLGRSRRELPQSTTQLPRPEPVALFWKAGVFHADAMVEKSHPRERVGFLLELTAPSPGFRDFSTSRPLTRAFVAV